MRVLDLFAGMGGWSQAFRDRGHDVFRVEIESRYKPTLVTDVLNLSVVDGGLADEGYPVDHEPFDLVLASPPCEKFSIAGHGAQWEPTETGFIPRSRDAVHAHHLTMHTLYLIHALQPKAAIMENPEGLMKKVLPIKPQVCVWYCRYGDTSAKPTSLWLFGAARQFYFEPECSNKRDQFDRCPHERAVRGSKTGTQGKNGYHERSVVPYGLSESICVQMEQFLAGTLRPGRLAV